MYVGWGLGFVGNPLSTGCTWQSTCFLSPNPCLSGPSLSPCCQGDKFLGREPHQLPLQWSDIAYGYLPTYGDTWGRGQPRVVLPGTVDRR